MVQSESESSEQKTEEISSLFGKVTPVTLVKKLMASLN